MNQSNPKKAKLAWYENNKDFTDPITVYLEEYFEVRVFGVPYEAAQGIIDYQPDIVIFDYRMPITSGIEMFQILKKKNLEFIPVFFTIWAKDNDSRQKITKAVKDEHAIFDKHLDCESLANNVKEYYQKKKAGK